MGNHQNQWTWDQNIVSIDILFLLCKKSFFPTDVVPKPNVEKKYSVNVVMNILQTPNPFEPVIFFLDKALTSACNSYSISIFLVMSSHSFLIQSANLIFLSKMSWLLKWVISSLESNPNTLLECNFFSMYLPLKCIHCL